MSQRCFLSCEANEWTFPVERKLKTEILAKNKIVILGEGADRAKLRKGARKFNVVYPYHKIKSHEIRLSAEFGIVAFCRPKGREEHRL